MKKKVLFDTNIFVYLLDDVILDEKIRNITKYLIDSDEYEIVIHPLTFAEANKIKDDNKKEIFRSKLKQYKKIDNPPKANLAFHKNIGCKNEHDKIDNELIYAVHTNCVEYLISNDKKIEKKALKIGLGDKILSIDNAELIFKEDLKNNIFIDTPPFIRYEQMWMADIDDPFFDSLKRDYHGFEEWYKRKQKEEKYAYFSKDQDGKITSFLLTKIEEEENDDYDPKFLTKKRLKISTFKVADLGKRIGETFLKIIFDEAIKNKVEEVYITAFEKQGALIELLEKYGFSKYGINTIVCDPETPFSNELIYIKSLSNKNSFPFLKIENQNIYLVPIQPKYHKLLFGEEEYQVTIEDSLGINTACNGIRKAFISNSNNKNINNGDILLFYTSDTKRAITDVGIVDFADNNFENKEEIKNMVRKRTAYSEAELDNVIKDKTLVLLFKHNFKMKNVVKYDYLKNNNMLPAPPQRIQKVEKDNFIKIIEQGGMSNMIEI